MPDVATGMYQPLQQPQQQALGPLQVLQLIGQLNQNKLFEQTYNSRQAIGKAYADSYDPVTGEVNQRKLNSLIPQVGFLAPEAQSQATANEASGIANRQRQIDIARNAAANLAVNPNTSPAEEARVKAGLAAAGIDGRIIQTVFDGVPRDPKARRVWGTNQANLVKGASAATDLVPGAIDENTGVRPMVPAGAAAQGAANPGGLVTEFSPLQKASQEKAIALRERNSHYAEDMVPINGFLDSIEALPPKSTGAGQEELNKLKTAMLPFSDWVPGLEKALGDPEIMANFTKGQKYATQLASQVANNIGPHTNQGLTTAFSATPNMSMTQLAAGDLGKVLYGLRNMQQVMMKQAEKERVPDSGLLKWAANDWSTRVNPAGFMWDRLDDTERERVVHKIEGIKDVNRRNAEMKKLRNSVEMGMQSGVLAGPSQQ